RRRSWKPSGSPPRCAPAQPTPIRRLRWIRSRAPRAKPAGKDKQPGIENGTIHSHAHSIQDTACARLSIRGRVIGAMATAREFIEEPQYNSRYRKWLEEGSN